MQKQLPFQTVFKNRKLVTFGRSGREGDNRRDGRAERLLLQEISVGAAVVAVSSESSFSPPHNRKRAEGSSWRRNFSLTGV